MKRLFLDFVLGRGGQWNGGLFFRFGHRRHLLGSLPAFRGTRLRPILDLQHVILHAVAEAIWITTGVLREKRSTIDSKRSFGHTDFWVNHSLSYRRDSCDYPLTRLQLLREVSGRLKEIVWERN